MLNNEKIFAPFQRDLARLLGAPVLFFLDGPGPPGGFFFAPPYPHSFPSSCLGTQIYRAAPAAPPLIFSLVTGGPPSHEDLPSSFFPQVTLSARFTTSPWPQTQPEIRWRRPENQTRLKRETSAKLPRNERENCHHNININNNINMFLNVKKFPLHKRENFPSQVGNCREIREIARKKYNL